MISLRIARLDRRIGICTVLASSKWQSLYEECEKMLGFSGNAASDVLTAWSRIAAGTFEKYQSPTHTLSSPAVLGVGGPLRRASSLTTVSRTVRTPGELISLERARALTFHDGTEDSQLSEHRTMDDLEASLMQMSIEHSLRLSSGTKIKISGPLHLQEEIASSYPPAGTGLTYSPHADHSPPPYLSSLAEEDTDEEEEKIRENDQSSSLTFDTKKAIQKYIDQVMHTLLFLTLF